MISRHGDVYWRPRSPDLIIPDFYLLGYLKGKVYITKPNTVYQLKRNIQEGITSMKVTENVEKRLEMCRRENGRRLKEIVCHT